MRLGGKRRSWWRGGVWVMRGGEQSRVWGALGRGRVRTGLASDWPLSRQKPRRRRGRVQGLVKDRARLVRHHTDNVPNGRPLHNIIFSLTFAGRADAAVRPQWMLVDPACRRFHLAMWARAGREWAFGQTGYGEMAGGG